ncbi:hypothetical protein ACQ4M3_28755 [Leptolyngbya sp. AN03gr2]|uniref:hypothetical protein n=1 Tax=unclassified Leptolyngbya TaxID=2650499 RepID=UPI003D322A25
MTLTLIGRWQTRTFLLVTIGLFVSFLFSTGIIGHAPGTMYYWVLLYVWAFGLCWDVLYHQLQQFMWDHDWPGLFQLGTAIVEGLFLAGAIRWIGLPGTEAAAAHLDLFALHYSLVWIADYFSSWVVMRLLFPRWRFRGGEWLGRWSV